jgi:hypothetical protein
VRQAKSRVGNGDFPLEPKRAHLWNLAGQRENVRKFNRVTGSGQELMCASSSKATAARALQARVTAPILRCSDLVAVEPETSYTQKQWEKRTDDTLKQED